LIDKFLPEHEPHDAVYRLVRMTLDAIRQNCPLNAAACYFEVWMLRLAGMFPDFFKCSVCMRPIEVGEERHLASGLQSAICSRCERSEGVSVHSEVPVVLHWILKNRLEGETEHEPVVQLEKGVRDLHELNQYWIRHYLER
jgi:DNA repair protein RecO (recombination protein O)